MDGGEDPYLALIFLSLTTHEKYRNDKKYKYVLLVKHVCIQILPNLNLVLTTKLSSLSRGLLVMEQICIRN